MTTRELLEQRTALVAEMRGYTSSPAGDGGDLSQEQSQKFDAAKTRLETVEKNIERQKLVDDAERRMEGTPLHTSGDGHLDEELRKFSLVRAIASQIPDMAGRVDSGREREISAELARRSGRTFQGIAIPMQIFEKRVVTTTLPSGGPGGNIIGTTLASGQFIDILRDAMVIKRLGARVLTGLTGNVDIPRLDQSATAVWFAENTEIPLSDPEIGKVELRPRHVGARTEYSRNMLLQSSPDIEDLLRSDFAQILAAAVDRAAIWGDGVVEPLGLLAAGIDVTTSMSTPTWEQVLSLIELVQLNNVDGNAFLADPSVIRKLRTVETIADTADFVMSAPRELAGYPLAVSNVATGDDGGSPPNTIHALIFGKWSDVLLGYWSTFDVLVNPYESGAYARGNVQIRGIITADVAIRHTESFAASIDVGV